MSSLNCAVFKKAFVGVLARHQTKVLSGLVLDGTQIRSHNGGQAVVYQGRKKAQTTNQLVLTNTKGKIIGFGLPQFGNRHGCYKLVGQVKHMLALLRRLGFKVQEALVHADRGFDTKAFRKYL